MVFTQWEFDQARNEHYWVDNEEQCYIYESGTRIPLPESYIQRHGTQVVQAAASGTSSATLGEIRDLDVTNNLAKLSLEASAQNAKQECSGACSTSSAAQGLDPLPAGTQPTAVVPVHTPGETGEWPPPAPVYPAAHYQHTGQPLAYSSTDIQHAPYPYPGQGLRPAAGGWPGHVSPATYAPYSTSAVNPTPWGLPGSTRTGYPPGGVPSGYVTPVQSPLSSHVAQSTAGASNGGALPIVDRKVEKEPDEPDLRNLGIRPHARLSGTAGHVEQLDPNFYVRRPGYKYFKVGVVFRVLWPELAGDGDDNMTIATTSRFREPVYCKIRWFVVVREGHDCCTCLPIQTYRRRGVTTKVKSHHAIMYTGLTPPSPLPSELPVENEAGMGEPIRVLAARSWESKMDPMSRVNFLKVYTVEHNVKVEDFGRVDPQDEWKLIAQFNAHWRIRGDGCLPSSRQGRNSYGGAAASSSANGELSPPNSPMNTAPGDVSDGRMSRPPGTLSFAMAPIPEDTSRFSPAQERPQPWRQQPPPLRYGLGAHNGQASESYLTNQRSRNGRRRSDSQSSTGSVRAERERERMNRICDEREDAYVTRSRR